MRVSSMILAGLLVAAQASLAEAPIDNAVTIRNTVVRSEAAQASEVVVEIAAATKVEVYERQGLWVRVAAVDKADAEQGWLRFTELRFGTDSSAAASAKPAAQAGGFAGFSRSVSGFLSGFRGRDSRTTQKTSTIGIRGLTVAELQAAAPDANALAAVTHFAVSKGDAEQFAGAGGLAAHTVPYVDAK